MGSEVIRPNTRTNENDAAATKVLSHARWHLEQCRSTKARRFRSGGPDDVRAGRPRRVSRPPIGTPAYSRVTCLPAVPHSAVPPSDVGRVRRLLETDLDALGVLLRSGQRGVLLGPLRSLTRPGFRLGRTRAGILSGLSVRQ